MLCSMKSVLVKNCGFIDCLLDSCLQQMKTGYSKINLQYKHINLCVDIAVNNNPSVHVH